MDLTVVTLAMIALALGEVQKGNLDPAVLLVTVLCLFFGAVVVIASKEESARGRLWVLTDEVLMLFLAVAWYQAVDEGMDAWPNELHSMLGSVLHAVVVYVAVIGTAWYLRERKRRISIVCGSFAHYLSFAAIKACHLAQEKYFSAHPGMAFACVFPCAIVITTIGCVKNGAAALLGLDNNEWNEATTELGLDVAGMCLAFVLSQAIQFAMCGEFDNIEESDMKHTTMHVYMAAAYALGATFLAITALPRIQRARSCRGELSMVGKLLGIAQNIVTMMTAWSYVFCLQWGLVEHTLVEDRSAAVQCIFAAVVASVTTVFLIKSTHGLATGQNALKVMIFKASALVCAWKWESVLNEGIDEYTKGSSEVNVLGKLLVAIILLCFILPLLFIVVKPKVIQIEDHEEEKASGKEETAAKQEVALPTAAPRGRSSATEAVASSGEAGVAQRRPRTHTPEPRMQTKVSADAKD